MAEIDKGYHKLLDNILKNGFKYEDPNRKGISRIQIPSYQFKHDFKDGFPAITTKKLFWKGIVGELLWFLRGDTNIKYLVDNNISIWNKDAHNYFKRRKFYSKGNDLSYESFMKAVPYNNHHAGKLGRVYGAQWRDWSGDDGSGYTLQSIDQISNLIKGLKENPMGTKHIVTAWNPAELDDMALPPCHWSFEILVEPISFNNRVKIGNKLNVWRFGQTITHLHCDKNNIPKYQFTLKWHQRSVDTFLGLPFNIASYALLAHIIGKMTNMIPKGIIGDLSNVHIYEPHLDAVKTQLSRSTNMHNSECELESLGLFKPSRINLDKWLSFVKIKDINLSKHTEQSAIPAEMLPYNK